MNILGTVVWCRGKGLHLLLPWHDSRTQCENRERIGTLWTHPFPWMHCIWSQEEDGEMDRGGGRGVPGDKSLVPSPGVSPSFFLVSQTCCPFLLTSYEGSAYDWPSLCWGDGEDEEFKNGLLRHHFVWNCPVDISLLNLHSRNRKMISCLEDNSMFCL